MQSSLPCGLACRHLQRLPDRLNNIHWFTVEVSETLESGEGFLEGHPAEPHYVINRGKRPVVSLVTFASVEGMPNQIQLRP